MNLLGLGGDTLPREQRDVVDALAGEFEALRADDSTRLKRYSDYRKENESSREVDGLMLGIDSSDYGIERRRRGDDVAERHQISLPFGMALTVKHAHRLVGGRPPDIVVPRREENAQERYRSDTMEKMLWGILRKSKLETLFSSAAIDGSQLGASCFEIYWDDVLQMPLVRTVDPSGVLVVRGLDDPHRFQRVYRFWQVPVATAMAEYRDHTFGQQPVNVGEIASTHKVGTTPMATIVQMYDQQRGIRFALGSEKKKDGDGKKSQPLWEWQHNLGFVNYVVIPNIGAERDIWGWADYEFVRSLCAYIPALFSREADILRMVANGAYQETGTGQDATAIKKVLAEGGVIPTRRESEIRPIAAPDVPRFADGHRDMALEFLKMLGFAPDAAWGGSDTRSGADRSLQMQPLIEFTAMKQTNWSSGLSRLGEMAFRMIEHLQVLPATYTGSRATGRFARQSFAPFKIGPDEPGIPLDDGFDPAFEDGFDDEDGFSDPFSDAGMEMEDDQGEPILLPRSPAELFEGDYEVNFAWVNRIDPDDPAFVLSELNKFQQGAQSLETTLERLGVQKPEDEMKRIEQEADRFPWLRQGLIAFTKMQLDQANSESANAGGQPAGDLAAGSEMMQTDDGTALDADAGSAALGGLGELYGGA